MNTNTYNFKTLSGIDTLYFFYVTNEYYDNFFINLVMQLNDQADHFREAKIAFEQHDLKVRIGESTFEHLGQSLGFFWFKDMNDLVRIGFKDPTTNEGLNDIQVQFMANGIYSVGITGLLRFTDDLLIDYVTGDKPITRADLNIFI